MKVEVTAYRHAAYDTPWWAAPSSRAGRFHRASDATVQYLALHPLGPAAEVLRHNVGPEGNPDDVRLNLWAVRVELDGVLTIGFDRCPEYAITPDELVGDDYGPTQRLADTLRNRGAGGVRVPSAALPGTDNLVLFGPRLLIPYMAEPTDDIDAPSGHLTDRGRPPGEVASVVRWFGHRHQGLEQWRSEGRVEALEDPRPTRW
ncbi:RES family NAD+ phosphorylase [Acidiferrimicrobium sp. IK]|uniref:RES family NAD+ phosphorylase n=1 Tax=Acidiferrimicrobium sp. IK TaxID=2871700 RepID=UPI0021CB4659|nr:RES family NAD+ phosphorylase [Acidiferrimicrobium sp. IK]MCU4185796.1 RES family NAD+ phosphorylase [Acidiferrimicrobium sp. IK]